jgi:hypothetical protein
MADKRADVQITLEGGEDRGGTPAYPPGGTISGRVEILPQTDLTADHVLIQLEWHTEGRGDRDGQVAEAKDIYQGVLTAGVAISEDFAFTLPQEPWSFAGHYINIVWSVNVKIDIPRAKDVNVNQPFILTPGAVQTATEPTW